MEEGLGGGIGGWEGVRLRDDPTPLESFPMRKRKPEREEDGGEVPSFKLTVGEDAEGLKASEGDCCGEVASATLDAEARNETDAVL